MSGVSGPKTDPATAKYFAALGKKVDLFYNAAKRAKAKGKDISTDVECPPTLDLADRTENIIGPIGVAQWYRKLYEEYKGDRNRAIFRLFRDIIEGSLGNIEDAEKRLEQEGRRHPGHEHCGLARGELQPVLKQVVHRLVNDAGHALGEVVDRAEDVEAVEAGHRGLGEAQILAV